MQIPHAHVVSISPDPSDRHVVVEVDAGVACERCAAGKGCGAGLLGSRPGERRIVATLAAGLHVRNGDEVSILLQPANVLRAAFIVYGYPLSGAVAAAILAFWFGLGDIAAAIAALAGLLSGVAIAHIRLRNTRCLRDFTPTVVGHRGTAD